MPTRAHPDHVQSQRPCHKTAIKPRSKRHTAPLHPAPASLNRKPDMRSRTKQLGLALALGLAAVTAPAQAADISGAGATFPYPLYAKWADTYKKETGVGLNYQSIGSGGGIKQIQARTVTFGATDAPLKGDDLSKHGLVQFPMVMGGIVPVVNLEGIQPGSLVIDGPTLAAIFMGKIKTWDDAALKKLNPEAKLPSTAI